MVIVSSDKDLMQLCDEGVVLIDTMKDQNRGFTYGPKEVEEKFGVPPALLGDVLALMGDSVDNVPGVPGVGPKTAAQLIQQMGSLDALLARIDDIKVRGADKVKAALREGAEQLRLSRQLVALDDAVATTVQLGDLDNARQLQARVLEKIEDMGSTTRRIRATYAQGQLYFARILSSQRDHDGAREHVVGASRSAADDQCDGPIGKPVLCRRTRGAQAEQQPGDGRRDALQCHVQSDAGFRRGPCAARWRLRSNAAPVTSRDCDPAAVRLCHHCPRRCCPRP